MIMAATSSKQQAGRHADLAIELLEIVVMVSPDHVCKLMNKGLTNAVIAPKALEVISAQPQRYLLAC